MSLTPLFPLQLVLFPGDKLPLHIFEPRYREMVRECLDRDMPFGLVSFIDNKVSRVGCFANIESVENAYDDGKFDIVCRGGDRFISSSYNSGKSYLQASVTRFPDEPEPDDAVRLQMDKTLQLFEELSDLANLKFENPDLPVPKDSFGFAHLVGFDLAQKQNLLEMQSELERLQFIYEHIERSLPKLRSFKEVRETIRSNGHFREFPPLNFNMDI